MKRSVEILTHFNCGACQKPWSVDDAPAEKKQWWCPWCGAANAESEPKNVGPVPEADYLFEMKKSLEEAGTELEKLFGSFKDVFKR